MKKIVNWVYSKDFTFWQNVGHCFVVVIISGMFIALMVNK
jgi:hypothetical protein